MSKVKRYFLILPILCIALIPCTSIFVCAADYNFVFNISEPVVDNWTGYIIQPRSTYSNTSISCDLYFWVITPLGDYSLSFPTVNYFYTGSSTILQFSSSASDESYFCTVYATNSYSNGSGTVTVKDSFVINQSTSRDITLLKGSYDTFWRPQLKNVVSPDESWPSGGSSYTVTWGDDVAIYNELFEANTKLTDLINGLDLTNEQLEELFSLLSDYLVRIELDTSRLVGLVNQLYDEWYSWTWVEEEYYLSIIELLEQLIEGTEEFTESSTLSDEQNELNRVEDELLNNEDASNAQNDIKVEVNENALAFIWDLISQFLNSNPKLFGIFISVLSLGIIALILNR